MARVAHHSLRASLLQAFECKQFQAERHERDNSVFCWPDITSLFEWVPAAVIKCSTGVFRPTDNDLVMVFREGIQIEIR